MPTPREEAQAIFDALAQAPVNAAGDIARIPVILRDTIIDLGSTLLDALEQAEAPHDERLQEAARTLRKISAALLGPGDRAPGDAVQAARDVRDAARVPQDADINVLIAEIAAAAEIYARPEYGPKSRWQALRDQITDLTRQLQDERAAHAAADDTVEAIRHDLETEQATTASLTGELEKERNRSTRDSLNVVQLRETLKEAEWNPDLDRWTITDDQRSAALDG